MKSPRSPTLEERIKDVRAEIDRIIDARVEKIAKQSPGVPSGVIRNLLTTRARECQCAQYLELCSAKATSPD